MSMVRDMSINLSIQIQQPIHQQTRYVLLMRYVKEELAEEIRKEIGEV